MRKHILIAATACCLLCAAIAGCAPQQAESDQSSQGSSTSADAPIEVAWSIESDCRSCHESEVSSESDGGTIHAAHAASGVTDCVSCHTDDDGGLTKGHKKYMDEGAEPPTELKKSTVGSASCTSESCHNVDELVEATASVTVLTDDNGTTVNPHEMMLKENHQSPNSQTPVECSSCHSEHTSQSALEVAPEYCQSCHHHNVYECNTCHA